MSGSPQQREAEAGDHMQRAVAMAMAGDQVRVAEYRGVLADHGARDVEAARDLCGVRAGGRGAEQLGDRVVLGRSGTPDGTMILVKGRG